MLRKVSSLLFVNRCWPEIPVIIALERGGNTAGQEAE
jgi:hypothetical protein